MSEKSQDVELSLSETRMEAIESLLSENALHPSMLPLCTVTVLEKVVEHYELGLSLKSMSHSESVRVVEEALYDHGILEKRDENEGKKADAGTDSYTDGVMEQGLADLSLNHGIFSQESSAGREFHRTNGNEGFGEVVDSSMPRNGISPSASGSLFHSGISDFAVGSVLHGSNEAKTTSGSNVNEGARIAGGSIVNEGAGTTSGLNMSRNRAPFSFFPGSNGNFADKAEGEMSSQMQLIQLQVMQLQLQLQEQQKQNLQLFQDQQKQNELIYEKLVKNSVPRQKSDLDCLKNVSFLPKYEAGEDIELYLHQFEQACSGVFDRTTWARLLLVQLKGSAREAVQALSVDDQQDYERVKEAVLLKYRRVPEVYRREFRYCDKGSSSYVEYLSTLNRKSAMWLRSEDVTTFEGLQALIVKETFFARMAPEVRDYLRDKEGTLYDLAVLADKFACSRMVTRTFNQQRGGRSYQQIVEKQKSDVKCDSTDRDSSSKSNGRPSKAATKSESAAKPTCTKCGFSHSEKECPERISKYQCNKCKGRGHAAKVCKAKPMAAVTSRNEKANNRKCSNLFARHQHKAVVRIGSRVQNVLALRDTGAAQTVISRKCVPKGRQIDRSVVLRGIDGKSFSCPLVKAHLNVPSLGLRMRWDCAVVDHLAYFGIDAIIGNDIIENVSSGMPIVGKLSIVDPCKDVEDREQIFPACAVTRAQSKKVPSDVPDRYEVPKGSVIPLENISRDKLIKEQKQDPSLKEYYHQVMCGDKANGGQSFHLEDGLLIRKWRSRTVRENESEVERQIVIPSLMRKSLLKLAHDMPLGGHMGILATMRKLRKNFFWPNMKRDVKAWVTSCHACQLLGKPGKRVPKAPLRPLPIVKEPFSRVQIDCVGPLPRSSSGHEYMLTIMCLTTRFPEAIPLRTIRSEKIVAEIHNFFCHFGFPKVIQSDNGTNFTSKVFQDYCTSQGIQHVTSVPYHPESQGAIERYHQTLKSMLNSCAFDNPKTWHNLVPQLLFCTRTSVHTSLGFTPAQMVFGYEVKGPLEIVKERYLNKDAESNVLDMINLNRENYFRIQAMAQKHLAVSKAAMKLRYDEGKVQRCFEVGDEVLVFLPSEKSLFHARFEGPFEITEKLSELNYRISTPSRKQKSRVVHINQIKLYHRREEAMVGAVDAEKVDDGEEVDESRFKEIDIPSPKLRNSEILANLDSRLKHVPVEGRDNLCRMLTAYQDVFRDTLGRANVAPISIRLKEGARPCFRHPYRYSPEKLKAIDKDVEFLLENDLAVPHTGEWSAPPVCVPKESGEIRVCQDYRLVNKVIESDAHPLPRILDCIDEVGNAKFLTKMDLLKGFFQIPIDERSSDILAFSTQKGLFRYKVLPFGVKIAPSAFQRVMNHVLRGLEGVRCYIDDVVIFSDDWDDHLEIIGRVLERFREHNLVVNLSKSEFARAEITYLGHRVGGGKVRPKQANIQAITEMKAPKTVKGVRRVLGAFGFYRRFCKNFAQTSHPLTELLKKDRKFVWSSECERSFTLLKSILEADPILKAPNFQRPFSLYVDASGTGIGGMLAQADENGVDMPVAYFSKKLNKFQRSYAPIELECLALVRALEHFEVYLSGGFPVKVYTDHNPLVFLDRMRNSNQKLLRWAMCLQRFDLNIVHIKGVENVMADMLSRLNEES